MSHYELAEKFIYFYKKKLLYFFCNAGRGCYLSSTEIIRLNEDLRILLERATIVCVGGYRLAATSSSSPSHATSFLGARRSIGTSVDRAPATTMRALSPFPLSPR